MVYKRVKRLAKKSLKYVAKVAKKRYFKGKGYSRPKLGQMYSDVKFLKSIVNAEKHRQIYASSADNTVAQVYGNQNGYWAGDITPNIGQGTGVSQRIGGSIKWHSTHFTFQFVHQSATVAPVKLEIFIVKVIGPAQSSVGNMIQSCWNANPFVSGGSIYDSNSSRNQDQYKNYRIIRKKKIYLPADNYAGIPVIKSVDLGFKLKNHHCRWAGDSATLTEGQILMVIFADNGNSSPSTACTLVNGVSQKAINTGINFNYVQTHYYYDN